MRRTQLVLRTSRKSAGSWTNPTPRNRDQEEEEFLHKNFSVDEFSLIDKKKMSFSTLMKLMFENSTVPQDPDAKVYGGSGETHKNYLKGEMKKMDKRIQPFAHEELMRNCLKTIDLIDAPNGSKVTTSFLEGKIVGLLFFSESDRSISCMNRLKEFHDKHSSDFVVIGISLCSRECVHATRQRGFYHCTYANGAHWVTRDAGVKVNPFTPLPRLVIVNGTTGHEITRSGITAIHTNKEHCLRDWFNGEAGCDFKDYLKTFFL